MNFLKRIVSLICVLTIVFSSIVVSASAVAADTALVAANFKPFAYQLYKDWKAAHPDAPDSEYSGFNPGGAYGGGAGRTSEQIQADYNTYVSGLQTDLGTTLLTDGAALIPLTVSSWDAYGAVSGVASMVSHGSVGSSNFLATVNWQDISYDQRFVCFDSTAWPFAGSYTFFVKCTLDNMAISSLDTSIYTAVKGSCLSAKEILRFKALSKGLASINGYAYAKLVPTVGSLSNITTHDISTSSRPAVITGSYVSGDGNTTYKDVTIVNETDKSIYNPVTGATTTYNSWAYDYSDRSYTLTATDGSTAKVVYGDDNVTINQGDTSTVINYYIASSGTDIGGSSSSGSGGSSTTTESIWDKIGNTLGSLIAGPFKILEAILGKLLDVLKSLVYLVSSKLVGIVTAMLGWMDSIPQLYGGFTAFLAAVFPFLPQELWDIFLLGAALTAIIWIIKAIRGR